MKSTVLVLLPLLMLACSPAEIATDVTRKAARTVVLPVVTATTPAPANELATDCIIINATNAELNDLARDIGNRAGTLTEQNIRMILAKPATRACIAGKGLAPVTI